MHAKKIASVYDMAMKMGAPVIGFIDCGGIRLQESVDALDGFGMIYAKEVADFRRDSTDLWSIRQLWWWSFRCPSTL